MQRSLFLFWMLLFLVLLTPAARAGVGVSLRGSPDSMTRQHKVAKKADYTFVETPAEARTLVEQGKLVPLTGNADYTVLESVSLPYARPEVRLFIERLAAQYHEATRERLVVTSLTRATEHQPWNAHALSVHPAGVAVDLRISNKAASRQWLEGVLLKLEKQGLLDATRERRPPHYHVALFPEAYRAHVADLLGPQAVATALLGDLLPEPAQKKKHEPALAAAGGKAAASAARPQRSNPFEGALIPLLLLAMGGIGYGFARKRPA